MERLSLLLPVLTCLTVLAGLMACQEFVNSSPHPTNTQKPMSNAPMLLKQVTITAREETTPPPGSRPQRDRAIGFVDIMLQLENPATTPIALTIQTIEIRGMTKGTIYLSHREPQSIQLGGLEYSTLDLHLTNPTGFPDKDALQAVVTYRVGDRTYTVKSAPVEVERL